MYSYAVKSIVDLETTEGAYLNALFWVSTLYSIFDIRKSILDTRSFVVT